MADERFLRRVDVTKATGLSRATIYRYMRDGTFPKQVILGPRRVGWRESQIEKWISTRGDPADGINADSFTKVARKLAEGSLTGQIILGARRQVRILRTDEQVVFERKEPSD